MKIYGSKLLNSYSIYKINIFKMKKQYLLKSLTELYREGEEEYIATTTIYQRFHFLVDLKKSQCKIAITLFRDARYTHDYIPYSIHEYRVRKVSFGRRKRPTRIPAYENKYYKIKLGSVFVYRMG
jgi:hypothetical protein